jgi:tRNA(Ile)-lysidine synthase
VSAAELERPISATEAKALFRPLAQECALVLAVSGGPDSTALLYLAAHWRRCLKRGPTLLAVTIDHGLRPESVQEARAVQRLARSLGVRHRIARWKGKKPATSLQAQARAARYRLLADTARSIGANCVVTAHTRDDQAETVLFRMSRGSGLTGLCGMRKIAPLPLPETQAPAKESLYVARPLLDTPKARLIATLRRAKIPFADDASNRDVRFARARWRELMPSLVREGLDAERIAVLARRLARADSALEAAVDRALEDLREDATERGPIILDAAGFRRLPAEVGIRLLSRTISQRGNEGSPRLAQVEMLFDAITSARTNRAVRRTLAGALMTLHGSKLVIERAPPRRRIKLANAEGRPARRAAFFPQPTVN